VRDDEMPECGIDVLVVEPCRAAREIGVRHEYERKMRATWCDAVGQVRGVRRV
jgi:hypothetical protein